MRVGSHGCVGCPTEMGCLGSSCPYNQEAILCNECDSVAEIILNDDEYLCFDCAEMRIKEQFDEYNLEEKCDLLGISFERID